MSALTCKERGRLLRALQPIASQRPTAALAREMGVTPRRLADVLTGIDWPDRRFASGAARVLGVSAEKLLSTPSAPGPSA